MLISIYVLSVIYCISRMFISYSRKSIDPVYATPALETLAILVMAPVLMVVDLSVSGYRKYKK